MQLFAYGTLLDPDVRALVLGRESPDAETRAAVLPGHRRVFVRGEVYPTLQPHPDHAVTGALVPLRSAEERERVQFFEGFELQLREWTVHCAVRGPLPALVCAPTPDIVAEPLEWDLEAWRRDHKDAYLPAAAEYMAGFGSIGIDEVHHVWVATGRGRR